MAKPPTPYFKDDAKLRGAFTCSFCDQKHTSVKEAKQCAETKQPNKAGLRLNDVYCGACNTMFSNVISRKRHLKKIKNVSMRVISSDWFSLK